jgi:hypothetical protein
VTFALSKTYRFHAAPAEQLATLAKRPLKGRSNLCLTSQSHDNLANDVIVVKDSSNSETAAIALAGSACHLSDALDAQLFTSLAW